MTDIPRSMRLLARIVASFQIASIPVRAEASHKGRLVTIGLGSIFTVQTSLDPSAGQLAPPGGPRDVRSFARMQEFPQARQITRTRHLRLPEPHLKPSRNRTASDLVDQTEVVGRSEEHTSELQSLAYLVCRLLLEKKKKKLKNVAVRRHD